MTARVALMSGGRISRPASMTMRGEAALRWWKWRSMFSTSTIGSSTSSRGEDERKERDAVDREAEEQVDGEGPSEDDGHGDGDDEAARQPRLKVNRATTIRTATASASMSSVDLFISGHAVVAGDNELHILRQNFTFELLGGVQRVVGDSDRVGPLLLRDSDVTAEDGCLRLDLRIERLTDEAAGRAVVSGESLGGSPAVADIIDDLGRTIDDIGDILQEDGPTLCETPTKSSWS